MPLFFGVLALILLLTLAAGLGLILRGPQPADRMVAVQLIGTTGVGVLLLLAQVTDDDALRNVALAFVLLALMALVAFVERSPPGDQPTDHTS